MSDDSYSLDDYAELSKRAEKAFSEDEVIAMQPDHIHSVMNNTDSVTVSLHTYGMHVNHTGRSQYDAEKNLETPFQVVEQ